MFSRSVSILIRKLKKIQYINPLPYVYLSPDLLAKSCNLSLPVIVVHGACMNYLGYQDHIAVFSEIDRTSSNILLLIKCMNSSDAVPVFFTQ